MEVPLCVVVGLNVNVAVAVVLADGTAVRVSVAVAVAVTVPPAARRAAATAVSAVPATASPSVGDDLPTRTPAASDGMADGWGACAPLAPPRVPRSEASTPTRLRAVETTTSARSTRRRSSAACDVEITTTFPAASRKDTSVTLATWTPATAATAATRLVCAELEPARNPISTPCRLKTSCVAAVPTGANTVAVTE